LTFVLIYEINIYNSSLKNNKKGEIMDKIILKPSVDIKEICGPVEAITSFSDSGNLVFCDSVITGSNLLSFLTFDEKTRKYKKIAEIFFENPVKSIDYKDGIIAVGVLNSVFLISTTIMLNEICSISLSNEPNKSTFDRFAQIDSVKIWGDYILCETAGLSLYRFERKELKFVDNFHFNMFGFIEIDSEKSYLITSNGLYLATKEKDQIYFKRVQSNNQLGIANHIYSSDLIKTETGWIVGFYLSNKTYKIFKLDEEKRSLMPKNEIDISRYTDKSIGYIYLVRMHDNFFLLFENKILRLDEKFNHEVLYFLDKKRGEDFLLKSAFVHKIPKGRIENLFLSTHQKNKKGVYEDRLKIYKLEV
jgi:hypothetical protein